MSDLTDPTSMKNELESGSKKTLPFVSVILPVYNDAKALRLCLNSLQAQTYPTDRFEVIVVDNGSTKDDPQAVVAEFPGYQFNVETKIGSYAARNKAISLASGKAYAFIDSDCIASPQWLEKGVRTLLAHPECGLVGGRVDLFAKNPERPTSVELYESITAFPIKKLIQQQQTCMTANMFVWSKVFDSVGLFNESLMSIGDEEWSRRVSASGLKPIYNDKVSVRHPARRTWTQIIKRWRRITGGRVTYQKINKNERVNKNERDYSISVFNRIYYALIPRISFMRKYYADRRLKGRGDRIRVIMVYVILHYVKVYERIRVMVGFDANRT